MARIFISYRRDDSASISGRIYDRLVAKFGRKRVFKGVDDIPAGVDFNDKVVTALLDRMNIDSYSFPFVPILNDATMLVSKRSGQENASADFANSSVVSAQ